MAMMAGYIKSADLAKCTVYSLAANLDLTIKSSWKEDGWDADREAMFDLCKSDSRIPVCVDDDCVDDDDELLPAEREQLDWDRRHTRYTYIALQIGRVMIKMGNTVWITDTEQHFTLAYLPASSCVHKTHMW